MSSSEKKFLSESQSTIDELMKTQQKLGEEADLTPERSQLIATEIIDRITEKKKREMGGGLSSYISGEFTVKDIKIAPYGEIFFSDEEMADRWYKCKLQFITIDEKTEKEKRSNVNYLVQAGTLNNAVKNIDEVMGGTMIDYVIAAVAETTLMDVFEYGKSKQDDQPEYQQ